LNWTPFPDLDDVFDDLRRSACSILGSAYIGLYLPGSFALRAGDAQSDADYIVVSSEKPTHHVERELRQLHDDIPISPGIWHQNIEGSNADAPALRDASGLGVPWLFKGHGRRTLEWDTRCNTLDTRWILRNHGITLDRPPIRDLVGEVSEAALARAATADLPGTLEGIAEWAHMDNAWTQKYVVQTYSRKLYTARTGRVASKPQALAWAMRSLNPEWRALLRQVADDRSVPWQPADPPRPGSVQRAVEYAKYVEAVATSG
jgi:hypothetical protein